MLKRFAPHTRNVPQLIGELTDEGVVIVAADVAGSYSLSGDGGDFDIDASTGEITVSAAGAGVLSGNYVLYRSNGVATSVYLIHIVPGAKTIDPTHPLTVDVGNDTYSIPISGVTNCLCGFSARGEPLIETKAGLVVEMPTPGPESATVVNYSGATVTGTINGAMHIRDYTFPAADTGEKQALDFRVWGYDATKLASFPLAVLAGDALLLTKSLADTGTNTRVTAWSSGLIVSFLDALPDVLSYRPGLFAPASRSLKANCIPAFTGTLPALDVPPALKWDGTSSGAFVYSGGGLITLDNFHYDALMAFGYAKNNENPGLSNYEPYNAIETSYAGVWPVGTWPIPNSGYRNQVGITRRFAFARMNPSATTEQQHEAAHEVAQMAIDQHGFYERFIASGNSTYIRKGLSGGHTPTWGQNLLMGCWVLEQCGETIISAEIAESLIEDTCTIRGNTFAAESSWWWRGMSTALTASNRAESAWNDLIVTLDAADATSITFPATKNWHTDGLIYNNNGGGNTGIRCAKEFMGVLFQIVGGSADDWYVIHRYGPNTDGYGWNGIGGTFLYTATPGAQVPTAGTQIIFRVAPAENIAWATSVGTVVAPYNINGSNNIEAWQNGRVQDVYFELSVNAATLGYVGLYGLQSTAWGGYAQNLPGMKAVKDCAVYKVFQGTAHSQAPAEDGMEDGNTWQAYLRHYIYNDASWPSDSVIVPVIT